MSDDLRLASSLTTSEHALIQHGCEALALYTAKQVRMNSIY